MEGDEGGDVEVEMGSERIWLWARKHLSRIVNPGNNKFIPQPKAPMHTAEDNLRAAREGRQG